MPRRPKRCYNTGLEAYHCPLRWTPPPPGLTSVLVGSGAGLGKGAGGGGYGSVWGGGGGAYRGCGGLGFGVGGALRPYRSAMRVAVGGWGTPGALGLLGAMRPEGRPRHDILPLVLGGPLLHCCLRDRQAQGCVPGGVFRAVGHMNVQVLATKSVPLLKNERTNCARFPTTADQCEP